MDYAALKLVHQSAVALSIAGFFARGAAMFAGASWVRTRSARTLPHVVDTVLIVSAIALAWMLRSAPFADGWLTAKVAGLAVYIALGTIALTRGRTPGIRAVAFVGALATFAYIVSVAVTKSPLGFLAGALAA